jgi:hypothetical protein
MLNCDSNCDLSAERFRRLNGTIGSWADALSVLDTLLQYKPPVLFCVIDSLDGLDNDDDDNDNNEQDETGQYVRSLVGMLAAHAHPTTTTTTTTTASRQNSSSGLFKVLFTTAGRCPAIHSTLVDQSLGQVLTTQPINDDDDTMTEA